MTGELLWENEGILVDEVNGQAAYYSVRDAGEDNIAVFYMTNDTYSSVTGWVKRFNRDSGAAVDEEAQAITDNESTKSAMSVTSLINGEYWYAVYYDERRLEGEESLTYSPTRIYMTRVELENGNSNESGVSIMNASSSALSDASVEVWSLDGKCVVSQEVASFAGNLGAAISGVARGAYIVKVTGRNSEGAVVTRSAKIMK
jgi:hypothetical protein